ncbi:hypothetical protein BU598_09535 [Staphylococcus arlettae]|uniref:hypothetical protein n=2 Tax=Staphylococcus TaxID=1279 RepID=UPI000E69831F|nr:hypothetical protein [Staphylococcus arlettae]RIM58867.1 hypothetical protein BU598_09535 [Staphylococcus arlettae]RIO75875.1 hypothetical protein BUZ12_09555 [Staphylococcus gallinarum]
MVGLAAISLTFTISGCGYSKSNDMAVSDALNSDRMLPVIVTDSKSNLGKDYIIWAGYIGNGKIKGMQLSGVDTQVTYNDLKKLNDDKFGEILEDMGKVYDDNGKKIDTRKFITKKAQTVIVPNEENDKAETVLFNFLDNQKGIEHTALKKEIEGGSFSSPVEKDPDSEWSTIKSQEETDKPGDFEGYELHIKTTKDRGIKMEKPDEYAKKYDNVKIDPDALQW